MPAPSLNKTPRTERGRKTLQKLLDAAASEFGEKGFHEASISSITRRASVALGTFYTYFDTKESLFQALVLHMSSQVKQQAGAAVTEAQEGGRLGALDIEAAAFAGFLSFAREHKEIYRIIDEAEFVDPDAYRQHYEGTALRILERLQEGMRSGELAEGMSEAHAWALMGMNVFLGLRYAVWSQGEDEQEIIEVARSILERGLAK